MVARQVGSSMHRTAFFFITKWIILAFYFPTRSLWALGPRTGQVLLSVTSSGWKCGPRPDHQIKPTLSNCLTLASSLLLRSCPSSSVLSPQWTLSTFTTTQWIPMICYITLNSAEAAVSDHPQGRCSGHVRLFSSKDVFHHALSGPHRALWAEAEVPRDF